jgi:predicted nucleotidyltransferase
MTDGLAMGVAERVEELLLRHPEVRAVTLTGSRARGETTALSDLDLKVEVDDFARFKEDLPELVDELEPLGKLWDPLGTHWNYMLMLPGPLKVDIILEVPQAERPPWTVSAETLPQIEHHFWDWTLWLGSKMLLGDDELVQREIGKMQEHLLAPMGVSKRPADLREAIQSYTQARRGVERRLGMEIDRRMEGQVIRAFRDAGVL